jgi:hypothetical protein
VAAELMILTVDIVTLVMLYENDVKYDDDIDIADTIVFDPNDDNEYNDVDDDTDTDTDTDGDCDANTDVTKM